MSNVQDISKKIGIVFPIEPNGRFIEDDQWYQLSLIPLGMASFLLNSNNGMLPNVYSAFQLDDETAVVRMSPIDKYNDLESLYKDSDQFRYDLKKYISHNKQYFIDNNKTKNISVIENCLQAYLLLKSNNISVPLIDELTLNSFGVSCLNKVCFKDLLNCDIQYNNDLMMIPDRYEQKLLESDMFYIPDLSPEDILQKIEELDNPDNISITISSYGDEGELFLDSFSKPDNAKKGSGLKYLKEITKILDQHGYTLYCEASEDITQKDKLVNLYLNAGFYINPHAYNNDDENIISLKRPYIFENRVVSTIHALNKELENKKDVSVGISHS